MVILIIPLGQLALGGISEKYLPPDNSVRQAQEEFDKTFPGFRTEPLTLVIESDNGQPVTDQQVAEIRNKAMAIPGFIETNNDPASMWKERSYLDGASKDPSVRVIQNGLVNRNDAAEKIEELRAIPPPRGLTLSVGGTPALEQDSIHSLFDKLPLMVVLLIITTTILMFLAFGSLVLPIKAALMSALTLGSTMGILTWMFVDGHGSGLMNYTPQPLMAPMIGLIIAVIWGLSTDYEVFLVSRMVEARERGMSTAEAIRIGTATTGRLITGAALILAVVAGAFVFSDLVMMKYLAFGLLLALLLDATIIRMFLVPAVMKLLGDDCWWAPRWLKRLQERLGLGETELPDERKRPTVREPEGALVGAGAPVGAATWPRPPHDPGHPGGGPRAIGPGRQVPPPPRANPPSAANTTRIPTPATAAPAGEPPTTRFSAPNAPGGLAAPPAGGAERSDRGVTPAAPRGAGVRPPAAPARGSSATGSREIESWLGDLRSGAPRPSTPPPVERAADPGDARAAATGAEAGTVGNEPTTAIPAAAPATRKPPRRSTRATTSASGGAAASALRICCVGRAGFRPSAASREVVGFGLDRRAYLGLQRVFLSRGVVGEEHPHRAVERTATIGTASSAPMMPASTPPAAIASTTASGCTDTARPITSGCRMCDSSCCTAMISPKRDQREHPALGDQRDDHGQPAGDHRADERDEGAEEHQRGQRQRERDAHDRQAGADADGVDERDQERRPHVADQRVEARTPRVADAFAHGDREDLRGERVDVAAALQQEDQREEHQQRTGDDLGDGACRREHPAGELGLVALQGVDRALGELVDLLVAEVREDAGGQPLPWRS